MPMAIGKSQEQTLRFDAAAMAQQYTDPLGPQHGHSLHPGVSLINQGCVRYITA
jgi:hypothetical protein